MIAKAIEGGEGGETSGMDALVHQNQLVRNESVLSSRFKHAMQVVGHEWSGFLNM